MEDAIIFEAEQLNEFLLKEVDPNGETNLFIDGQFNIPLVNVLWTVVAGVRYDYEDPAMLEIMAILRSIFRGGTFLRHFFFILKYFPELSGLNQRKKGNARLRQMFAPVIEEHKKQAEAGVFQDDFIGRYLEEMKTNSHLNEKDLLNIILDLFAAGSETVSSTLGFTLSYMAMFPEAQAKCREEVDRMTGEEKTDINLINQNR